ncbi:aminotransferase class III-fold pyridoxal phosphate-dependent enzyme [Marinobacter sp. ELB17]|uniref:aminotransferase class III-fold pyridoxal phosphate-dependent enzyme n=1 Tax=Marinobacter sp. ELB17 TaxID=270374 RepID=UPI0000F3750A|nr:aminotransferase class III-fold pyridoxal phosphate-dependent enzyme [Marinobacter sp. ELB17]EBA00519.1 4-aminobutyrate aminotransferase [Marinobacter sp. ELB17]
MYVANGVASAATQFADRTENAVIWNVGGNRIINFAGGIGVLNIGHCHPKVMAAAQAQVARLMYTCQTVIPYAGYVRVAEAAMCRLARAKGLILIACGFYGNTLRFLMPVTVEEEVLDEGLAIVEACLAELAA